VNSIFTTIPLTYTQTSTFFASFPPIDSVADFNARTTYFRLIHLGLRTLMRYEVSPRHRVEAWIMTEVGF
jgi:hypothetical protein